MELVLGWVRAALAVQLLLPFVFDVVVNWEASPLLWLFHLDDSKFLRRTLDLIGRHSCSISCVYSCFWEQ